jgi:glycosyltransferase involved in cell wall biosynthesis
MPESFIRLLTVSRISHKDHSGETLSWQQLGFCWVGGARYTAPLSSTAEKKWRALEGLQIQMDVIGFSDDVLPHTFSQHAHFRLLPRWGVPLLRHLTLLVGGTLLTLCVVLHRNAHVVVAQSPFEGFIGSIAKRIAHLLGHRTILIVESHGDFEWQMAKPGRSKAWDIYPRFLQRAARSGLVHADLFRAVSLSTRRQLEARAPGKPIVQFPAWIDTDAFDNARREIPLGRCWDLLFAGVLAPVKGVEVLLEAFARVAGQHPQSRVWVVGRPESARYLGHLRLRARDLGLAHCVVFENEIPPSQLAGLMGRVRGLALPSYSEGFPRVLIEAMRCGTPVLGSRVGGIPEIIHDGEDGYLVPPGDSERLAEAMTKLFSDKDIEGMGRRAKDAARHLLSPETYVDGHRQLFMQAHALWAAG